MPKNTSESEIPTIKGVAEYLKVTDGRLPAQPKKIPAFKVGGTWRFRTGGYRRLDSRLSTKAENAD